MHHCGSSQRYYDVMAGDYIVIVWGHHCFDTNAWRHGSCWRHVITSLEGQVELIDETTASFWPVLFSQNSRSEKENLTAENLSPTDSKATYRGKFLDEMKSVTCTLATHAFLHHATIPHQIKPLPIRHLWRQLAPWRHNRNASHWADEYDVIVWWRLEGGYDVMTEFWASWHWGWIWGTVFSLSIVHNSIPNSWKAFFSSLYRLPSLHAFSSTSSAFHAACVHPYIHS